jgi:hypothetical protein
MNLNRLYEILRHTTVQLRKGDVVSEQQVGPVKVIQIDAMPHESEALPSLELVDMEFLTIGVDKVEAAKHKAELISILDTYPHPERLAGGPSYIEVGAEIGDQGAAFQLFALGKVLDLWGIITPRTLGFDGEQAKAMAVSGFIMMSGYPARPR